MAESGAQAARVYTHIGMVDMILANPRITRGELARHFGYRSENSISRLINSDAFQALLNDRRKEIVNPEVAASVEENLRVVAQMSLERIQERLAAVPSDEFVLQAAALSTKALNYGAKPSGGTNVVVIVPGKAQNNEDWLATVEGHGRVIDG